MTYSEQDKTKQLDAIKVAALTGRKTDPASRFRIRQYIPRLAEHGIIVQDHIPVFGESCGLPSPFKIASRIPALFKSRDADVIWIGRSLVQGYATFERLLKKPRVMDVDDAIWLRGPFGKIALPHIARGMDIIVAGNSYLAEYFSQFCKDIHIVPTSIDLDRYHQRTLPESEPEDFVIGWTGLACNYQYIEPIEPALAKFLENHDRARLRLVSNKPFASKFIRPEKIEFIRWTETNEASELKSMSVGIMPLTDDEWTRGKCSFKMLQYMAVGLPVVVSPVGMNKEVIKTGNAGIAATNNDQWYQALETLYNDWKLQVELGSAGRKAIENFFSVDIATEKIAQILTSVAAR